MLEQAQQPKEPGDGLAAVVAMRQLADRLEAAEVERAIRTGWTWSRIAEALGVTRQAVHKKYAKRLAAAGIEAGRRRDV
jgi:DNA invertase Pin-like site-specific DNA recombinase